MFYELHKHSQYSMFDGFDKIKNIVKYAKQLGHKALGISDHGTASGIAQLYAECNKAEIKPIMGCEVYFQPNFDKEKGRFHLCLFAKNATGYRNLCQILTIANEENFFRVGNVTLELLERFSEGLICTSACVGGFIPKMFTLERDEVAYKAAKRFKAIFGDDFYLEVQPIKVDELRTQENVNEKLFILSKRSGIKCILTTDSHFTAKEDFDSYIMMHRLGKLGSEKGEGFTIAHAEETYKERYMHSEAEIVSKFEAMHGFHPGMMLKAMQEIYDKIDVKLDFSDSIPTFNDVPDTYAEIKRICIEKLKATNRWTPEYIERTKYELSVINKHELCDYFLIVHDYVKWAKDNDIYVGPGRGSVGGSLSAELLGITDIDAITVGTDFDRFLRPDKKKMPDIDLDFENGRQKEVMDYILEKYKGRSSLIVTFGYYKSTNLINDLCKIYEISGNEVARIKSIIQPKVPDLAHFEFEDIDFDDIIRDRQIKEINKDYPNFVKHFCKLCGQVKYYGQHPAGVLVTRESIGKYVPMTRVRGNMICSYDKYDVESLDMVKFDVLALKTMNVIHEIERLTGDKFHHSTMSDEDREEVYKRFSQGQTLGIFQLNKPAAQNILIDINADSIQDVIAAISCNRPGTLKLGMHKLYAEGKRNLDKSQIWYPYTADSYGAIIYQEHVMRICYGLANMLPPDVDKLMKFKFSESERGTLKEKFVKGAKEHSGVKADVAQQLFESMALYMFNKGHGAGYALISEWQMYHKVKHPTEFWFSTVKWEIDEFKKMEFMSEAAMEGVVFMLPHVNYTADYSIRKIDGDEVIQAGYNIIKNVGEKAALDIEKERIEGGKFTSYDDFYDRCKPKYRSITSRTIESLLNDGALEFNKKKYMARVQKWNTAMYMKGNR